MDPLQSVYDANRSLIQENFRAIKSEGLLDEPGPSSDTIIDIHDRCSVFVEQQCAGRDESHGAMHMAMVTQRALHIFRQEQVRGEKMTYRDLINVVIGAMLHDVADHKYDPEDKISPQVQAFIKQLTDDNNNVFNEMWTIINTLSFSKEKKAGGYPQIQKKHMKSFPMYIHRVRHIISDADRLEAIGKIGAERCIEYTKEMNPEAPLSVLQANVKAHAEEKLYRLPFPWKEMGDYQFFHTQTGRDMAIAHDKDTHKYIDEFLELKE